MTGTLASELADGALSFARAHRYTVVDRPRVDLVADPAIDRTDIRVDARFAEAVPGRAGHGPVALVARRRRATEIADETATRVFAIPKPAAPRAVLRVTDPDGGTRDVVVAAGGLTIGRATDNDLVAIDGRVSRHHGRIVGSARDARLRRPGQHQRLAGQRHPRDRGRARRRRSARGGGYVARGRGRRGARLMDGFLLVLWAVRLLFLGLIYLFLFRVVRALLRDLRAAAREPADRPGRLVVLASPSGEPAGRSVVRPRRHHGTRARRQQRHRHRRPVRVGRPRRADLSRPDLVHRGPREHERLVRQRPSGRGRRAARASATSCRSARSGCGSSGPAVTSNARARRATPAAPRRLRPRPTAPALARVPAARPRRDRAGRRQHLARGHGQRASSACTTRRVCSIYIAALFAPTRRRSWPAGGPTRSCCRPSRCSAASRSCSCSACRRTS